MYNVLDVCRYVINYSNDMDYGISNLKLQKVLYFIQAVFLMSVSEPCFKERIEAWDFGPVVPEAYREYKRFGSTDIPKISYIVDFDHDNIWNSKIKTYTGDNLKPSDRELINQVVDELADYSATDLVGLTHRQLPWMNAYSPYKNKEITLDAIKEYFI